VKLPLKWLAEYVDLPASVDALAERLTLAGLEIEDVATTGPDLTQLVVGHVLECGRHPDADRLSVCRVDLGSGEPATIVCGAPNVRAGLRVAVALPGTTLPDGTRLKKTKIRGVASEGMICSSRELGLGDDHAGILELGEGARAGARLPEVLSTGDSVLDLEITPNRGDWASLLGMAREVRALFGSPLRLPPCEPQESDRPAQKDVRVAIDAPERCHAYFARVVRGVRIGASPQWLVERLESAGLRSINNAVDATNLVMLELGQPLHAFDLASLRGAEIRVRKARAGEKLAMLDGEVRALGAEDLVIADAERAIALAGVMGGSETEVRAETRDLVIESAHFDAAGVRRSSRRLGVRSEASYRFERGVDPEGVARAADRCARLIAELAGGAVSRGRVEARGSAFAHCDHILLDPAHPQRLLGVALDRDAVAAQLARLEIHCAPQPDGRLRCQIPSWRNDLSIPQDLVEEVARIHGYDRIPVSMPHGALQPVALPRQRVLAERARDSLCALGLLETRSIPLISPADLDALRLAADDPRRASVRVRNPISEADPELRSSLLPGLLRAVQRNLARQVESVRLFELGRCFLARGAGELPLEPEGLAAVLVGAARASLWAGPPAPLFFEAKGVAERLLRELGTAARFRAGSDAPYLHPASSGELRTGKRVLARMGELHPETAARYELAGTQCAVLEVDLEALAAMEPVRPIYAAVSAYPASRRDLAVLVASDQAAAEILDAIRSSAGSLLTGVALFDRYEGRGVPAGKVSLAFRLEFQRPDRTLTEAEVAGAVERVVRMLAERFAGELRQGG
jgi:phenylalanyl-tRNA synthetase beta chain